MTRGAAREADDRSVAALLAYEALVEIRTLSGSAHASREDLSAADTLQRVRWLANLCHNLPLIARAPAARTLRRTAASERERAMAERPMSWTWETSGSEGQKWILDRLEEAGLRWTPPPPLPVSRKRAHAPASGARVRLLRGWPGKTNRSR